MHTEPFDFDRLPDRNHVGCAKWNRRTGREKAANIIPLSIADMEFKCAPCVVEAARRAAEHGYYGYTDADGPYFEAVAAWMKRRHGFDVRPEWIVAQGGIVPAMSIAVRVFTEPGDGVLLHTPGYTPFRNAVVDNGRAPVWTRLTAGADGLYRMDFDDIRQKAADPSVKMMLLCSPHNPTGRVWEAGELRALADICRENGVLLVSDEIHSDLALYEKHTVFANAAPEMLDRMMILTAPSKTFNIAGLQVANTIIPNPDLRARFKVRMNADGYSNNAYFGYHAMIAAYTQGDAWVDALHAYLRENHVFFRRWFAENLPKARVYPAQGTYLAWTDWRAYGMDDAALEHFLRGEAMLFLDEGTMFGEGGEGHMRFNIALPRAALKEALERLKAAAERRGLR